MTQTTPQHVDPSPAAVIARYGPPSIEAAVALVVPVLFVIACRGIDVDPLDRLGQVSGLAAVQLRTVVAGGVIVSVAFVARRTRSILGTRVAIAAAAGLVTAITAGGLVVALHRTPWGLFASFGDAGNLAEWADAMANGRRVDTNEYPPLFLWFLARYARLRGMPSAYALKEISIYGTALLSPVAFLAWRTLLSPLRALLLSAVLAMVFVEPYKPYSVIVLLLLPVVLVHLVRTTQASMELTRRELVIRGAFAGTVAGVLFVLYPGWFLWSAPGAAVAVVLARPWRAGATKALLHLGAAAAGFLAPAGRYLLDFATNASGVEDRFVYFDVTVEPAYIAMWRGDFPGDVGLWPPPGELGGVGLFSLLLLGLWAVALWRGAGNPIVVTATSVTVGAWGLRMWLASQVYATKTVQLYPRTTMAALLHLLVLGMCGAMLIYEVALRLLGESDRDTTSSGTRAGASSIPMPTLAVLVFVLGLASFAGSATGDRYLPADDGSIAVLAYQAHITPLLEGGCPHFAPPGTCR